METTITGKVFKNRVRGSGLTMKAVCKEAGISETTAISWAKDISPCGIYTDTYDRLVCAYLKLRGDDVDNA